MALIDPTNVTKGRVAKEMNVGTSERPTRVEASMWMYSERI
jgi:hypothetical protein